MVALFYYSNTKVHQRLATVTQITFQGINYDRCHKGLKYKYKLENGKGFGNKNTAKNLSKNAWKLNMGGHMKNIDS
jgi:hypothetical protein